jgi:hypothetical protein
VQRVPSLCTRQQEPFLSRGIRHDVLWLIRRRSPDFPEEKAAAALHEQGGTRIALQERGGGVDQLPTSPRKIEEPEAVEVGVVVFMTGKQKKPDSVWGDFLRRSGSAQRASQDLETHLKRQSDL